MDINLPGMSGVEAVKRLKPLLPDTQFVMLTVYEDADHIYNALAAGATGYVLKQTPRAELLGAVEEVHRGGSPMTSNIARKVVQSFKQTAAPSSQAGPFAARTGSPGAARARISLQGNRRAARTSACPPSTPTSGACTRSCTCGPAPRRSPNTLTCQTLKKNRTSTPGPEFQTLVVLRTSRTSQIGGWA